MPKSFIIVEHDNDKYTFEAIIRYMQMPNSIQVASAEDKMEIEWIIRSAEESIKKPTALKKELISLFRQISKGKYDKVGIIWDMDNFNVAERIVQMNNAIALAKAEETTFTIEYPRQMTQINEFVELIVDGIEVKIGCYFVNYQGKGEIENILKAIQSDNFPSPIADCVDTHLPSCLKINDEKELREKDLVKLWINHFQRYDTLPKGQRVSAYTTWENMMKREPPIFDFGKDSVIELKLLKEFLNSFR